MDHTLVDDVLRRLGIADPLGDSLHDLRLVYAAWCEAVPFDNVLKMIHLAERRGVPLPGSTAEDFFGSWLEHRTGGTCWAGNGALHDLLEAVGFEVERALATMLQRPDNPGPNHGSVVVTIDGTRWITDASILSSEPIRLTDADGTGGLPRLEWRHGMPHVIWRTVSAPQGFPCRFEQIGAEPDEWDALHQLTAAGSKFNTALSVRVVRGSTTIGFSTGRRFEISAHGTLTAEDRDREGRDRFLVEELGLAQALVARIPDDRPPDA